MSPSPEVMAARSTRATAALTPKTRDEITKMSGMEVTQGARKNNIQKNILKIS